MRRWPRRRRPRVASRGRAAPRRHARRRRGQSRPWHRATRRRRRRSRGPPPGSSARPAWPATRRRHQASGSPPRFDYVLELFASSGPYSAAWICRALTKPRKGRGAVSNETARFETEKRVAFDDGWGSGADEPRTGGDPAQRRRDAHDHRPQRLAGYRLRPLDQPVSRLRARLHLLLCAAEPRLSRPVARSRFRDPHLLQAAGGGAAAAGVAQEGLQLPADRARQQYRPLPAGRAAARRSPARSSKCCAISATR